MTNGPTVTPTLLHQLGFLQTDVDRAAQHGDPVFESIWSSLEGSTVDLVGTMISEVEIGACEVKSIPACVAVCRRVLEEAIGLETGKKEDSRVQRPAVIPALAAAALERIRRLLPCGPDAVSLGAVPRSHDLATRLLRMAWLRRSILKDMVKPGACYDGYSRWLPSVSNEDDHGQMISAAATMLEPVHPSEPEVHALAEAFTAISACDRSGPSSWVKFPTIHVKEAHLVQVRIRCLPELPGCGLGGVALSPSSIWCLQALASSDGKRPGSASSEAAITEIIRAVAAEHHVCFLVELCAVPEPEGLSPPHLVVERRSLGLALMLAAWAAKDGAVLKDLIVTGEVKAGRNLNVERIEGLGEKLVAAARYADYCSRRGERTTFVLPRGNETELEAFCPNADVLWAESVRQVLESRERIFRADMPALGRVVRAARSGESRIGGSRDSTQSNCYTETCRCDSDPAVAYVGADWEVIDSTVKKLIGEDLRGVWLNAPPGASSAVVVPYGNDPRPAVRRVLGHLYDAIQTWNERNVAARLFVPVPVYMGALAGGGQDTKEIRDHVLLRISCAVRQLYLGTGPTLPELASGGALEDQVRFFPGHLLLVAFTDSSRERDPDAEAKAIAALRTFTSAAGLQTPRLFLVASDSHHESWFWSSWAAKQPSA